MAKLQTFKAFGPQAGLWKNVGVLAETIEGWILVRIQMNLDIPEIEGISINPVNELKVA